MVNSIDLTRMFRGCFKIENIEFLKNWNVRKCKNFSEMFYGCNGLKDITPLKDWNIIKGEYFCQMFGNCYSIEKRYEFPNAWGKKYDDLF